MADLVAADLTYTAQDPVDGVSTNGRIRRVFKITTAAGDYPTGGLPLTNASLGCPNSLEALRVLDPSAGADLYQYTWDKAENKIKVVVDDGTSGVPAEHANSAFTSPAELVVEVTGW